MGITQGCKCNFKNSSLLYLVHVAEFLLEALHEDGVSAGLEVTRPVREACPGQQPVEDTRNVTAPQLHTEACVSLRESVLHTTY